MEKLKDLAVRSPYISAVSRRMFKETQSPAMVRRFSKVADEHVHSSIGKKMSPLISAVFTVNSMTGVGILTMPLGFARAGVLLGGLTCVVATTLAYVTATFMCEALSIANALHFEEAEIEEIEHDNGLRQRLHQEHEAAKKQWKVSPPSLGKYASPMIDRRDTVEDFCKEFRESNVEHEFKIRERLELGTMGEAVLSGKVGAVVVYTVILCMTYGAMCGLLITADKSLAQFAFRMLSRAGYSPDMELTYRSCVAASFCITLPLCFADLQKTKNFTIVVVALRCVAVLLMVAAGIAHAVSMGPELKLGRIPLWKFDEFPAVYGNAVYMVAIHHNLPSVIAPVWPGNRAPAALGWGFLACGTLTLIVASTAMLAWDGRSCPSGLSRGDFCEIAVLYNLNFAHLPWLGGAVAVFITLYPALSLSIVPATAITTRNTLSYVMGMPPPDPEAPLTARGLLLLLVVLVPPFTVASLTHDIQAVTRVVGGYAGLSIALLLPLLLVMAGRRRLHLDRGTGASMDRPMKSPFANWFGYGFIGLVYFGSVVLVTQEMFF